jgi:hypothetical protein
MASPSDGSGDLVPIGPATDALFSDPPPPAVGGTPVPQHRSGRRQVLLATAAVAVLAAVALLAALLVFRDNRQLAPWANATEPATQSATDNCDQGVAGWTTDVQDGGNALVSGKITNIRTGRHDCCDRVVFDITSAEDVGYRAEYVPVVRMDPSGMPLELAGDAFIQLSIDAWAGESVPTDFGPVTDWQSLRQINSAGSFEGITRYGIGVDHQSPFNVYRLPGTDGKSMRVVVDIAH